MVLNRYQEWSRSTNSKPITYIFCTTWAGCCLAKRAHHIWQLLYVIFRQSSEVIFLISLYNMYQWWFHPVSKNPENFEYGIFWIMSEPECMQSLDCSLVSGLLGVNPRFIHSNKTIYKIWKIWKATDSIRVSDRRSRIPESL